jgi:hypothetical protein
MSRRSRVGEEQVDGEKYVERRDRIKELRGEDDTWSFSKVI